MPSDVVISIEEVWKQYRLGVINHASLQRDLQSWWARFRGKEDPNAFIETSSTRQKRGDSFWALQGVTLDIRQGDVIGVIGRNGAGKSTLLKILSRVTSPTKGQIKIRGRVASLLEVGTGFHPDLTGRENVFLNGAILGMTKQEIRSKLDEIINFSELEKFVDTPVKRYSSGMYVRLAFAVAAHLEPEILVVDEVLAVGDAQFQKKCLGKMEVVSREGRTVLFVSHNMAAISALCNKSILLVNGKVVKSDFTSDVIESYLKSNGNIGATGLKNKLIRRGNGKAEITKVYFTDKNYDPIEKILSGYECMLVIEYASEVTLINPVFKFTVYTLYEQPILHCDSSVVLNKLININKTGIVSCHFIKLPLTEGNYKINVSIENNGELLDHLTSVCQFTVANGDFFESGRCVTGIKEVCLANNSWQVLK